MVSQIVFVVIIFLYINNPFFFFAGGVSSLYFFVPFLVFIGLPYCRRFLYQNRDLFFCNVLIILFCILRTVIGGDPLYIRQSIFQLISFLFFPAVILCGMQYFKVNFNRTIYLFGLSSISITLLCIIFPSLNYYIKNVLTIQPDVLNEMFFRGFGLSGSLTSGYGTVLVVFIVFLFYNGYFKNKVNYLIVPLALIAMIVNARTALIAALACIMLRFMFNPQKGAKILMVVLVLLTLIPSIEDLPFLSYETKWYIQEFFYEIQDMFMGTSNASYNTSEVLFERMLVWPRNLFEWILGRGYNLFADANEETDIGFLRQLNYGGLIYLILILFTYWKLVMKTSDRYIRLCAFAILIIINTKGDYLTGQDGYRFLNLLILFSTYKARNFELKIKKTPNLS